MVLGRQHCGCDRVLILDCWNGGVLRCLHCRHLLHENAWAKSPGSQTATSGAAPVNGARIKPIPEARWRGLALRRYTIAPAITATAAATQMAMMATAEAFEIKIAPAASPQNTPPATAPNKVALCQSTIGRAASTPPVSGTRRVRFTFPPLAGFEAFSKTGVPVTPLTDDQATSEVVDIARGLNAALPLPQLFGSFSFESRNDQGDPPYRGLLKVDFHVPQDSANTSATAVADERARFSDAIASTLADKGWAEGAGPG